MSDRIPLLAPFFRGNEWTWGDQAWLGVTEVFDFTEVVDRYKVPIVDMLELKVPESTNLPGWTAERHKTVIYDGEFPQERQLADDLDSDGGPVSEMLAVGEIIRAQLPGMEDLLQCWSCHLSRGEVGGHGEKWPMMPAGKSSARYVLKAEIQWTALPDTAYHDSPAYPYLSGHGLAEAIAAYSKPGDRLPPSVLAKMKAHGLEPSQMKPDEQINCLDHAFALYVDPNSGHAAEWAAGEGVWKAVGRWVKFQPGLVRIAEDLLRHLFGIDWSQPVPPVSLIRRPKKKLIW